MTDETNADVIVARRLFERIHSTSPAGLPTALTTALWGEVEDGITYARAAGRYTEAEIGGMVVRAIDAWAREDGSEPERLPGVRLRAMLEVDA